MTNRLHKNVSYASLAYRALRRYEDRVAFIDGDREFSYRDSAKSVQVFRDLLVDAGVEKGVPMALVGGNHPETFFTRAAAIMEGARVTSLHPENGIDDHTYALNYLDTEVVIYDSPRFDVLIEDLRPLCPSIKFIPMPSMDPTTLQDQDIELAPPVRMHAEDIIGISLSGGTTGKPKGIMHSDRTLSTNATFSCLEWDWPQDIRFLAATPLSHASGAMAVPILMQGGCLVMLDKFTPERFRDVVKEHNVNSTFLVPTMIHRLLALPDAESPFNDLETVIYGASKIDPSMLRGAVERFGQKFVQLYGQSEAPNLIAALKKADHDPNDPEKMASCGRPVGCADVALLDDKDREVPVGEVGEICVRGPIVMAGYWQKPELTEETFSSGWLHTGDLARANAQGYLTIVGRKKDMIITGGLNVYPAEVETVMGEFPGVAAAAVLGIPDEEWGEKIVAFVTLDDDAGDAFDETKLQEFIKARKGSVQTPKAIFTIDAFPLTKIGKPDKVALQNLAIERDAARSLVHEAR